MNLLLHGYGPRETFSMYSECSVLPPSDPDIELDILGTCHDFFILSTS